MLDSRPPADALFDQTQLLAMEVLICERGSGVRMDCLPATQSAIFALSAENSKIARMLAHFIRPEGSREA